MKRGYLREEIIWRLRTLPQRLGQAGIAGLLLAALAAAAWGLYLGPRSKELAQSRHFLQVRKAAIEADLAQLPPAAPKSRAPKDALFAESEFQTAIERFIALAQTHGLALSQGAYKLDAQQDSDLRLAVLNFPAQGNYLKLRAFLEDAHSLPGVRLQTLQINRVNGSDTDINMQIQFSMLLRGKP